MPPPPSNAELFGKVQNAIKALQAGRRQFGTLKHWPTDREALGLTATADLWPLLLELLDEIRSARPENCYAGGRPPQRCYEDDEVIKDEQLWAFAWSSARMGKRMYVKFVLKKDSRGDWHYFHIDCHPDAPKKKKYALPKMRK